MEWLTILLLICIGTFLVVAEIVFIPGIFVAGTIGVLLTGYGVYLSYSYYENPTGHLVLAGSVIINILALYFTLRGRSWEAFALKEKITSRVNEDLVKLPEINTEGLTISALKPIGKALFDEVELEVRTNGEYLSENKPIRVIRIEGSTIFVKELN